MTLKFTPEDFVIDARFSGLTYDSATDVAQKKFDQWLSSQPKIKLVKRVGGTWCEPELREATHQCIGVCIEEIEKKPCEHEPRDFGQYDMNKNICKHCGVKLRAEWKEL